MAVSTIDPNGLNVGQLGGTRNLIINGAMQVAQRGTSTTSSGYLVDRFSLNNNTDGAFTQSQETTSPPLGFGNYLKINTDTADASIGSTQYLQVLQAVEAYNIIGTGWGTASALPVTISFWVKSNVTGTYVFEIQTTGSYESSHNYTINSSDVWEYKTVTVPAFTATAITFNNSGGMYLNWWLAAGSTWNTGTISEEWTTGNTGRASGQVNFASAINNYWQITGVQLEVGDTATSFEHESYGTTLQKCQRYYYQLTPGSGGTIYMVGGVEGATGGALGGVSFPTVMRVNPTATILGTNTTKIYTAATGTDDSITIGGNRCSTTTGSFEFSGLSGATPGQVAVLYNGGSTSGVSFDAEL